MSRNITLSLIALVIIMSVAAACNNPASSSDGQTADGTENSATDGGDDSGISDDNSDSGTGGQTDDNDGQATGDDSTSDTDDDIEYTWDSSEEFNITLQGDTATVDGPGAGVSGTVVTIKYPGTYLISGTMNNGRIIVDTKYKDSVYLVLNGIVLSSSESSPVYIKNAAETEIILADNSDNFVSDSGSYTYDDSEKKEPNAAIFSNDALNIRGNGALTVSGNFNDGITSEDGLTIYSGEITVTAVDDGIRGKDFLSVINGRITIDAGGDGLKSDNETDSALGYIEIVGGTFIIDAGGDALTAATDIHITDGAFSLTSGGGSSHVISDDVSSKGIKGLANVTIEGGVFEIDSADDAVHSNRNISFTNASLSIETGDDGMHADTSLEINGGEINITKSYEGLESGTITINDGTIHLTSSDDGINLAGGVDGSGMTRRPGPGGQGGFDMAGDYHLYINGGYIVTDANGDGIDSNGTIDMTGGIVLVNGPTANSNGAFDCNGTFTISGGLLIGAGSAGMAEAPGTTSTQYSVLMNFTTILNSNTVFNLRSSNGDDIVTFTPTKNYQSVVISSPELAKGSSYEIYYGGSASGVETDGLVTEGTYHPGTKYTDFTISGIVTTIGQGPMH